MGAASAVSVNRGNLHRKNRYGAPVLSAVRNREASVFGRLTMYYSGSDFNPCHRLCPLYGGCPPLGGSVMGGSTVEKNCAHCMTM